MKKILTLMFLSFYALVSLNSCTKEEEKKEEEIKFLVTSPLRKDTTDTRDYVCHVRRKLSEVVALTSSLSSARLGQTKLNNYAPIPNTGSTISAGTHRLPRANTRYGYARRICRQT